MSFITPGISKTRTQFPLSPKKPLKKTISSLIALLILLTIIYIFVIIVGVVTSPDSAFFVITASGLVFLLTLFLFALPTYVYQRLYMTVYFYDLTDSFIIIKKGVFTPKEISVPYERIQDIYVDQDIFDRFFGLYDVHISSATISSGFEAHIDGVEKQAADGLKTLLLTTVQEKIKRNPQHPPTQK